MRFSNFSDYSLRVLLYLGAQPERLANIAEIAERHGISQSHLMKVVLNLGRCGYVQTVRGKGGGLRLGRPAEEIILGDVLRQTETDFQLVECFSAESQCRITGGCSLKGVLGEALGAMFGVLDRCSLADLLRDSRNVVPKETV